MKKVWKEIVCLLLIAVVFVFLSMFQAFAGHLFHGAQTSQLGTAITASGAAKDVNGAAITGPGIFYGIVVQTDGTNNCTISVNNVSAAGKAFIPASTVILGSARLWSYSVNPGLLFTNGVYITISAAGGGTCSVLMNYDQ